VRRCVQFTRVVITKKQTDAHDEEIVRGKTRLSCSSGEVEEEEQEKEAIS